MTRDAVTYMSRCLPCWAHGTPCPQHSPCGRCGSSEPVRLVIVDPDVPLTPLCLTCRMLTYWTEPK